jgi:hypothetical protein
LRLCGEAYALFDIGTTSHGATTYPTTSSIAAPGSHFTCPAALPSRNDTS